MSNLKYHIADISPSDGQTSPNLGLDSSLKKNTAFIKRLRTSINPASLPLFQQDIQTLSIQKYLSELISAFCEGCLRLKTADEFGVACEIASALHQRFGPDAFTRVFAFLIRRAVTVVAADRTPVKQAVLEQKDRDEKDRSIRQRTLLRLITELWLVGVLRSIDDSYSGDDLPQARLTKAVAAPGRAIHRKANGTPLLRGNQDEPFPLATLKDLLEQDRYHNNLSLAVFFAKYYALQFLGVQPSKPDAEAVLQQIGDQSTEQDGLKHSIQQDDPVVSRTLQVRFKNVLTNYYEKLSMALVNGQIALGEQARRNAEIAVKTGQLFEDRQENYEKQVKEQERLVASGHVLSEILGMAMPNLNHSVEDGLADISIGLVKKGDFLGKRDGPGIWEDEEERRFYEKLIDLRERVPMILLEDPKKKHADDLAPLGNRPKSSQSLDGGSISMQTDANHRDLTVDLVESSESDLSTPEISNRTTGSQVDALLARLPSLMVKEAADQLAIAFCFLNSKASRNRLLKALQEVPKGRIDLLPLYARLATTLGRYFADILENMIVYLHSEFRSLQRRKDKDFLSQVRTGNVRYLAELIKFGAVPDHVIFHCLKVSLDDFSRMNIELMAVLLENCGRYLLRNHDTSAQMMNFMEALRRRKGAQHLGQQEKMLVENTIYFVNPPERAAIEQKERSPIELFVHKLVYEDMTKTSYPTVFKLLRKLHWEETDVRDLQLAAHSLSVLTLLDLDYDLESLY